MLTREIYEKGQLVIPKSIRDMLGFDVGTAVSFFVDGNRLIIEKKRSIAGEFAKMAASGKNKKIRFSEEPLSLMRETLHKVQGMKAHSENSREVDAWHSSPPEGRGILPTSR